MPKWNRANLLFYLLIGLLLCFVGYTRYRFTLNERLLEAVRQNQAARAMDLLTLGADPNYSRPTRWNKKSYLYVLTEAIQQQENLSIVQALLEHGANPNPLRSNAGSPFIRALGAKRPDILRLLLEKGAHESPADRETPMHLAIENPECYHLLRQYGYAATLEDAVAAGDATEVLAFLEHGTEINRPGPTGNTPLIAALERRQDRVVKLLIARGADVNQEGQGRSPLDVALYGQKQTPEILTLLKAKGAHLNLVETIWTKDLQAVRLRLREGADVNYQFVARRTGIGTPYSAPLFQAIQIKSPDCVRLLLDAGANVNARSANSQTPLMQAAAWGDPDVVRVLIAKGADVNTSDGMEKNAVKYALRRNHFDIYRLLRDSGAEIDLFDAASAGDVEKIRQLVQQGAKLDLPNPLGETPLMLAAVRGQIAALNTLLDLGAKLEVATPYGETALLKVAWSDHTDSARVLLERGANPNTAHKNGKTALIRATDAGRVEIVRLLLAKGADVHARTHIGDSALKIAEQRKNAEILALLKQAGAQE